MKLLIADSGSTKTSWVLLEVDDASTTVSLPHLTMGLNPLYTKPRQISGALAEVLEAVGTSTVDALYFYGAGCSEQRIPIVRKALSSLLPPPTVIEVTSDVVGACRAAGAGACCIMGTGSVAAYNDPETDTVGYILPWGYILGDEGSGAYFGRQVLSDYLKSSMPPKLRKVFEAEFGEITRESVLAQVYQGQFPNRYLASFAPFIGRHLSDRYCHKVALQGVKSFFRHNVRLLHLDPGNRISFVGSVAFHLQDVIRQVASSYGFQIGVFLKDPIEGLVEYHKQQIKNNLV